MFSRNRKFSFALAGLGIGFASAGLQGCEGVGDLAAQCGLVCPTDGILQGNASISGIASIDGFFGAVIDVRNAGLSVSLAVRAELEGLAATLGIDASGLSTADLAAAVKAEMEVMFAANVQGSLTIDYVPAKCEANLEVSAKAAAECDVDVEPGSVSASCEGSCEIDVSAQADCRANGMLSCSGKAPMLACEGECSGSCELEAAAACSGSCEGTCSGACSACAGGNCETDMMGNITNCKGTCDAMCTGNCELSVGAMCSGRCTGNCTWDPGEVDCDASVEAKCEASASANVDCKASCEGEVVPPSVSAECSAQVEAKASASVECTPPELAVNFEFAAGLDAQGKAEFMAFLNEFKLRFSGMLAASAKLEFVGQAAGGLITAAGGAVAGIAGSVSGDLKATIGAGCAVKELPNVGPALDDTMGSIADSTGAVAMVGSAVGG